jgi:hypothetical protein
LDDEHGINSQAWNTLADILYDYDCQDIVDAVKATEGRYYLTSDAANTLRERILTDEDGDEGGDSIPDDSDMSPAGPM